MYKGMPHIAIRLFALYTIDKMLFPGPEVNVEAVVPVSGVLGRDQVSLEIHSLSSLGYTSTPIDLL